METKAIFLCGFIMSAMVRTTRNSCSFFCHGAGGLAAATWSLFPTILFFRIYFEGTCFEDLIDASFIKNIYIFQCFH